jgi:hypothetical protein
MEKLPLSSALCHSSGERVPICLPFATLSQICDKMSHTRSIREVETRSKNQIRQHVAYATREQK